MAKSLAQNHSIVSVKQILVTGCAGFIGAATCQNLIDEGWCVVGLDNLNDYYDTTLKEWRLAQLESYDNFEWERGDIKDAEILNRLFRKHKFTAVINLAAMAGVRYSIENPSAYVGTNILGTVNLLECMKFVQNATDSDGLTGRKAVSGGCNGLRFAFVTFR